MNTLTLAPPLEPDLGPPPLRVVPTTPDQIQRRPTPDPPEPEPGLAERVYDKTSALLVFLIDGQGWIPVASGIALPYILYRMIFTGHGTLGLWGGLIALTVGLMLIVAVGVYRSTPEYRAPRPAATAPARPPSKTLAGRSCRICGQVVASDSDDDAANRAAMQRHEDAHAKLMNKYGVGVAWSGQRVWKNARGYWQGYTMPASWGRMNKLPPEKQMAIFAAGVIAAPNTTSASDAAALEELSRKHRVPIAHGQAQARKDLRL